MFDKITYISNEGCNIKLNDSSNLTTNLMNMHLIFEDNDKKILGEVDDIDGDTLKARFLGEISGDQLIGGNIRKPSLDSRIRIIDMSEVPLITGINGTGFLNIGFSPLYDQVPIYLNVNNFFSNHFAIFGNTGSGKSCGVSRLFQNMFQDQRLNPYKANIFIFDSSGEYYNSFSNLNTINPNYNYRFISTNETDGYGEKLRLPIYLLNKDDLALLLQCTSHSQLPIIERMLKLALAFSQNDVSAQAFKNHIIAKAIMTILYTNETAPNKRNEIFSILASCSTNEFNLEAPVQGVGYVRKFRECFLIDNSGNFSESVLLTSYVSSFIKEEYDSYEPKSGVYYNLDTLEKALNFTLISEGWLRNEQTYGDSVTLKVRLHELIAGENAKYFDVKEYVSLETFLSSLLIENGKKYQIVNINLNDVDDEFAKVLTKIYSRLIFDFSKGLKNRGSIPFHIILEEAHRYIQSDHDRFLFGYNIFERIAKEGRKYGVILGIITQRPVELSDNVISQCTNFLIFKINHPIDIKYIREMVPHITDEIIEKQKSLQPGTCLGFGLGFKIPLIIKMEMPNPSPLSGNCDVFRIWSGDKSSVATVSTLPVTHSAVMPASIAPTPASVPVVNTAPAPVISPSQVQAVPSTPVPVASNAPVVPGIPTPSVSGVNAPEPAPAIVQPVPNGVQGDNSLNNVMVNGPLFNNNSVEAVSSSPKIEETVQKTTPSLMPAVDKPVIEEPTLINSSMNNIEKGVQSIGPSISNSGPDTSALSESHAKYVPEDVSHNSDNLTDNTNMPSNDIVTNNTNVVDNSPIVDISGESMNKSDDFSINASKIVDISGESMKKSDDVDFNQKINIDNQESSITEDTNQNDINMDSVNGNIKNDDENFKDIDELPKIVDGVATRSNLMGDVSNYSRNGFSPADLIKDTMEGASAPEITDVKIDDKGMTPIDNEIILDDEDDETDFDDE